MVPLTGAALVSLSERLSDAFGGSRTDLVRAAGYIRCDGRVRYVDFYEQLLAAKGINPTVSKEEDMDYEELPEGQKELYDYVKNYGEKWDHQDIMDFLSELKVFGIETPDGFKDTFRAKVDNRWNWEAELAEEITCELEYNLSDSIAFAAIDWQKVWDHNLSYDYDWFDFDGEVFVFSKF